MMLSRQALHRLKPTFRRVGTRVLGTTTATATTAQQQQQSDSSSTKQALAYAGAIFGLVAAGAATSALLEAPPTPSENLKHFKRDAVPVEDPNTPPSRPDLPTIPLEDVAEHCDEDSLWYTFRGAVYDLTFFINGHPGGTPVSYLYFLSISFLFVSFFICFRLFGQNVSPVCYTTPLENNVSHNPMPLMLLLLLSFGNNISLRHHYYYYHHYYYSYIEIIDGGRTRFRTVLGSLSSTFTWTCRRLDGKVPYW